MDCGIAIVIYKKYNDNLSSMSISYIDHIYYIYTYTSASSYIKLNIVIFNIYYGKRQTEKVTEVLVTALNVLSKTKHAVLPSVAFLVRTYQF